MALDRAVVAYFIAIIPEETTKALSHRAENRTHHLRAMKQECQLLHWDLLICVSLLPSSG
jgi:hypothetical protein